MARLVNAKAEDSSPEDQSPSPQPKENALTGTVVSSLYSLKDTDNTQGGFFVFGDLSVRQEGHYRLEFTLYELRLSDRECWMLARVLSDKFQVFSHKEFPGLAESTFLTRSFSDQGVRLRLRKDSRSMATRKRNSQMSRDVDQLRGHPYYGQVHSPEQQSPTGPPGPVGHPDAQYRRSASLHMDRSRASMTPQGTSYFAESPHTTTASYGYAEYEDRPAKRHRYDESTYSPYTQSGPRTVPDMGGGLYPSTSYQMPTQTAIAGLPGPMPEPGPPMFAPPRQDGVVPPELFGPTVTKPAGASMYTFGGS